MKFRKPIVHLLQGTSLVFIGLLLLAGCHPSETTPTPTPWSPRVVGTSKLGLVEAWHVQTGPPITLTRPQPNLFVADDKIIVPYNTENNDSRVTALSLETGQVIWQTHYKTDPFTDIINSATLDTEHVYVVDEFRVYAFDLETGEIRWETQEFAGHTGYYFRPWDLVKPLRLHADTGEVILIDPVTGAVLERGQEYEKSTYGLIAFVRTMRALSAVDLQSGQVLWSRPSEPIPFTSQMRLWPSFIDDDVVFLSGGAIYVINRVDLQTGATRWETESIYVSNFALDDSGKLYAMRQDGVLVVLDVNTGDGLDEIQFSGPQIDPHTKNYSVVVANSYVVVNFIDTQEIIALRIPPAHYRDSDFAFGISVSTDEATDNRIMRHVPGISVYPLCEASVDTRSHPLPLPSAYCLLPCFL